MLDAMRHVMTIIMQRKETIKPEPYMKKDRERILSIMSEQSINKKLVIIVNGHGGAGKDCLCDYFSTYYGATKTSAIDPVKAAADLLGVNVKEKSDKTRKFLSDFKTILDDYGSFTTNYLKERIDEFIRTDKKILFVIMRDLDQIDRIKEIAVSKGTRVATLLIRRKSTSRVFGNKADDECENYAYDYIFDNDGPLELSHMNFVYLVKTMSEEVK